MLHCSRNVQKRNQTNFFRMRADVCCRITIAYRRGPYIQGTVPDWVSGREQDKFVGERETRNNKMLTKNRKYLPQRAIQ